MTAPTGVLRKHSGKSPMDRRDEAEQMLVLRRDGWSPYDISKKFGVSEATVKNRISYALESRTMENADELRKMSTARLDQQYRNLDEIIKAPTGSPTSKVMALAAQRNVEETLAKLWGYNAPVKVDATVTLVGGVDAELDRLSETLGIGVESNDKVIQGELV